jgi:DNA-binding beta-propeller fold protein YncE
VNTSRASAPSYVPVAGWERMPAGYEHPDVAAVATDSKDRVFVFCRSAHPVMIYERDGRFVGSWGEGMFTMRTHGLTIGPDDSVWCTDDAGHSVRKFTPDGKLLLTLGDNAGKPSETGYDGSSVTTIARGGPPFNRPTNLALAPNGDLYVSDGYGNARVHRFSPAGKLLASWGQPGTGPGQFMLPHGIAVDRTGNVFVCDRESDRIQVFTADGRFLREITEVQRPTQIVLALGLMYVSELGWRAGQRSFRHGPIERDLSSRVSILEMNGTVVARIGGPDPCAPGSFCAPHGLAIDKNGDLYVAEVVWTIAGKAGLVPPDCHTVQKLALAV